MTVYNLIQTVPFVSITVTVTVIPVFKVIHLKMKYVKVNLISKFNYYSHYTFLKI